jgi:hypothetical protein
MTLCPIAAVSGCKSCPIFKVCPAKSIIGDHDKSKDQKGSSESDKKES